MRKLGFWTTAAVAAVAIVGCGGSSGNGGGSNPGGTRTAAVVKLSNTPGAIEVTYLGGAGRAEGDVYAVFSRINFVDSNGFLASYQNSLGALQVSLTAYPPQTATVPVQFKDATANYSSRLFESFTLDPSGFKIESASGVPGSLITSDSILGLPGTYPARIRAFPGRFTTVPVFLTSDVFPVDPASGSVTYDEDVFRTLNLLTTDDAVTSGKIVGYLSDYIRFDISSMDDADKPVLYSDGSPAGPAGNFLVSGDDFGVSAAGNGSVDKLFNVLTLGPDEPYEGYFAPPILSDPAKKGTFSLLQTNPSDLSGLSKITALNGYWRNLTDVLDLAGSPAFEVVLFPGSQSDVDGEQQAVAFVWTGSPTAPTISNLYYGWGDLRNGTFRLYPLRNLNNGDIDGEITGSLTNYTGRGGVPIGNGYEPSVRNGTYTFTAGTTLPSGFLNTGTFVVFRR